MDIVPMYISVLAFDDTDDGYLVLPVQVPADKVKYMVPGNIITLKSGCPAILLGVGSTHEKAVDRHHSFCKYLESMERKHKLRENQEKNEEC